jgi:hypothetical protein
MKLNSIEQIILALDYFSLNTEETDDTLLNETKSRLGFEKYPCILKADVENIKEQLRNALKELDNEEILIVEEQ